jgi:L-malate glycosyltransferase
MNLRDRRTAPAGVAYVLPGLGRGGTEKHVCDLAAGLDRRRFSPCVINTAMDGTLASEFTERGVPVINLPYRGLSLRRGKFLPLLRDAWSFFEKFGRVLQERHVAVVHAYLPAANVLGMAATLGRTPTARVVSKRALCRYKEGHRFYAFLEDFANLRANAVMVNSLAVAEDVRRTERFVGGKMFLVYNGLAISVGTGSVHLPSPVDFGVPADAALVTYVANLREDKGHLCLVEAARAVIEAYPAACFLFVGKEDGEAGAVRARILELGLQRHVLLAGSRQDVAGILKLSRMVAHPGVQEGLSNAILEAMAEGIPVVASRAGGNPEALEDGVTGMLVPPGDAGALATAILELLRDPERAQAMGRAARERARQRFSIDSMVAAMEQTYLELLDRRSLSRRI